MFILTPAAVSQARGLWGGEGTFNFGTRVGLLIPEAEKRRFISALEAEAAAWQALRNSSHLARTNPLCLHPPPLRALS